MATTLSTPAILLLGSIKPTDKGDYLESPSLADKIVECQPFESNYWAEFESTEPGSLEESAAGARLDKYYLLEAAHKVHEEGEDQALWSRRFTEASKEMHGDTDEAQAVTLINQELSCFDVIADTRQKQEALKAIYDIYGALTGLSSDSVAEELNYSEEEITQFKTELDRRFPMLVEAVKLAGEAYYTSAKIREVLKGALTKLGDENAKWLEWTVTNTEGKAMFSVNPSNKTIDIPDERPDVKTKEELLGLLLHEVGVHAGRAVAGYSADNEALAFGLPGYLDFEEGLGVLCEFVASGGVVPDKLSDRYVDIALAHGVNGVRLTRMELIDLGIQRRIIRFQGNATPADIDKFEIEVRVHVNRIFRGGTGRAYLDEEGNIKAQAVFSKDIAYFLGFPKPASYVVEQLRSGKNPKEIFDYLLSGKFDPTNKEHVRYLTTVV